MPDNPSLGVTAVWEDRGFDTGFQKYLRSVAAAEKATDDLADKSQRADRKREESAKKAEDGIGRALARTRREILSILFFIRLLEQGWRAAWQSMEGAAEQGAERLGIRALARQLETDLGGTAEQIRELANGAVSVQDSMQVVLRGLLTDQGQFSDEYARLWEAARVAAVTGMAEADEAFEAFVTDLVEGTGEATDAIHPIYGLQNALEDYATASGRTVEQLSQEEAAHVALQQIYKVTNELLDNGARDALEYAEAWERVQARLSELKEVFGIFVTDSGILRTLDKLTTAATQSIAILGATLATVRDNIREGGTEFSGRGFWGELLDAARGDPSAAFARNMQRYADALGLFRDEVDKSDVDFAGMRRSDAEDRDKDLSPIVDHLLKREKLIEDHTHRVEKIWDRYRDRVERAELRYNQAVERAGRQADRERERAQRRYERQREQQQRAMHRRLEKLEAEHHLRLEQNSREFRLREIQSEALYQYERGLLVAYGDVLGIEDLDARYALEKEAREQNFEEQQRQERESFELRRRFMREELEEQLELLRMALEDQMEEIRQREEDRIAEAEERRKEELESAAQARDQQLEEEQRQHARSLEQWNQYWTKLAQRFELGLSEVEAILKHFLGADSEFTTIMQDFLEQWNKYMGYLTQLQQVLANIRRGANAPLPVGKIPQVIVSGGGGGAQTKIMPYQYGGSMVASHPTRLIVGEGHMPELVSVRPMSSLNTMRVSWAGGPIPVSGSGLQGADTSGLGDSIAQGLLVALEKALVGSGATYG